jgi:hypothetical protein
MGTKKDAGAVDMLPRLRLLADLHRVSPKLHPGQNKQKSRKRL